MAVKRLTQIYMIAVAALSLVSLVYVYTFPPASMFASREGVPYFSPKVANPENNEPLTLNQLIRHYRGD